MNASTATTGWASRWCSPWLTVNTMALVVGLAAGNPALGQAPDESEVSVQIRAKPSEITIGDLVTVFIEVEHSHHLTVSLPEQPGSVGSFEIRSVEKLEPTSTEAGVSSRWSLTVSTFETGEVDFPKMELAVAGSQAGPFRVTTDPVQIAVESVLPQEAEDILDIKSPLAIPRSWWTYWPWPAGVLVLGLLGWWLWQIRKRKVSGRRAGPPLLPPEEEALKALRALEASELLHKQHVKPFYTQLSEILRRYLWRRFGIAALEATTSEIVVQLSKTGAGRLSTPADSILQACDLVKFARLKPPREKGLTTIVEARNLVQKGRPHPLQKTADPDP